MSTALLAMMALGVAPVAAQSTLDAPVVSMSEWNYDDLYSGAWSAEDFIDEMEVYGSDGEEIGDVEDVIVGADGNVLAVIAEVGGFWDIGDTHISVPWSEVSVQGEAVTIPVSEDNIGSYGLFEPEYMRADEVKSEITGGVDDAEMTGRAWRVSELMGNYARLRKSDGGSETTDPRAGNYGYVNDLLVKDGKVAAVVVTPDVGYGTGGYRAYPYYGPGWTPGTGYYDMPYSDEEVRELDEFEYNRIEVSS